MCTCATFKATDRYFGRNLDYEFSFDQKVTVVKRNYPFSFKSGLKIDHHYAMIGMAYNVYGYPLFYDGINEKGIGVAGLNFPGNAYYRDPIEGKNNVASFEFIPYILSQADSMEKAKELVKNLNVTNLAFSEQLPPSPLHWMISDAITSIVIESTKDGVKVYDNPVGVMTNNPTFDIQLFNLKYYMKVSTKDPVNTFSDNLSLKVFSRGMGGLGLPGDLSSPSRFVKAAFTKLNSISGPSESQGISQFFHILASAEQQKGLCDVGDNKFEFTIYSSCCNLDKGYYYYTTYENSQITKVDMFKEDLDGDDTVLFPLIEGQQIKEMN